MDIVSKFRESVKWSIIAHFVFFMIIALIILFEHDYIKIGFSIIGIIYAVYYLFFTKYNKDKIFLNSLILFLTAAHIGITIGYYIDIIMVLFTGIAISIQDVLSFTKLGKRTANAKAMSSTEFMSKLILYSKSTKDGHLIPTKGMGDFLFYSLWLSGIYYSKFNIKYLLLGFTGILIGTIINYLIISKIYQKENYKGFPATIIPFICLVPLFLTQ